MKFPKLTVDKDAYYKQIVGMIQDVNCHVFFDTNIISQMYRLNSSARNEFYVWLDDITRKGRAHVPNWAIHEYSNRYLSTKTSDYLSELDTLKKIPNILGQVSNFLKMYVDASLFKNNSRFTNNKDLFLSEFDVANSLFLNLKDELDSKKIKQNNAAVHQELLTKFQSISIDEDVFDILKNIDSFQQVRYANMVPPGFKDSNKEYNSAGDLILWQEILNFAKNKNIKKAILVTRDMKKDYVYSPERIIESGYEKANTNNSFKIADERLVFEFERYTASDEFYIINFDQLVGVLSSISAKDYKQLAIAVQMNNKLFDEQLELDVDGNKDDCQPQVENSIESEELCNVSEDIGGKKETKYPIVAESKDNNVENEYYMNTALSDKDFLFDETSHLGSIIKSLKFYNWESQNKGIDMLKIYLATTIENSLYNRSALFVIGRNIYQAACGNAFKAISFVKDLKSEMKNVDDFVNRSILDGCIYEVYFDSLNNYRSSGCKGYYISSLYEYLQDSKNERSLDFIRNALKVPKENYICYLPIYSQKVLVKLEGKRERNLLKVSKIIIDNSILDYKSYGSVFFSSMHLSQLVETLSILFAIPRVLISVDGGDADTYFEFTECMQLPF